MRRKTSENLLCSIGFLFMSVNIVLIFMLIGEKMENIGAYGYASVPVGAVSGTFFLMSARLKDFFVKILFSVLSGAVFWFVSIILLNWAAFVFFMYWVMAFGAVFFIAVLITACIETKLKYSSENSEKKIKYDNFRVKTKKYQKIMSLVSIILFVFIIIICVQERLF